MNPAIFGFRPTIDNCNSPEPSLEELLFGYYASYFPVTKAQKLADEYIVAVRQQFQ